MKHIKALIVRYITNAYLIARRCRSKFYNRCLPSVEKDFSCDQLRYIECDKANLSIFCIKKLLPFATVWPFPLDELLLMAASVVFFRPRLIIDWGTHIGVSARVFYETCRQYGIKAEIHSIDLPENAYHPQHPGYMHAILLRNTSVCLHRGDGATVAVKLIKQARDTAPLCMLDGDHSYETVKRELIAVSDAAPEATLLIHDTFHQIGGWGDQSGAYEAVKEFINAQKYIISQLITLNMGRPGLTLIKLAGKY